MEATVRVLQAKYPQYYFPIADVCAELVPTGTQTHSPNRGDATHHTKFS